MLQKNGLYVVGGFDGRLQKVTLDDEHGPIHIHLLPFLKPAHVRPHFQETIDSYDEAIQAVLSTREIDTTERNVLIAHQFVVSGDHQPETSDSETTMVGGLDSVDASLFGAFDYVALGHLHRPQRIGLDTIRYGGSPLKYSFSEARQDKSVTILDFGPKGDLKIEHHPLKPLRDLRELKGPLAELLRLGKEDEKGSQDYLRITLTDEDEIYDALGQLRPVFPNLMVLDFENSRTAAGAQAQVAAAGDLVSKSPLELFATFYELQNGSALNEEQIKIMEDVLEEAGGVEL
jgi:exonuclease SbcD